MQVQASTQVTPAAAQQRSALRSPLLAHRVGALLLGLLLTTSAVWSRTLSEVWVNDIALPETVLMSFQQQFGYRPAPGRYWYDRATGAWGLSGQGTAGFIPPGLALGGTLRADASNGNTGVFINGRELAQSDVQAFQAIGIAAQPGRWWVDAYGNAGAEGGPALFNVYALARQSGGDSLYRKSGDGSSLWLGSDGSLSYHGKVGDRSFDYHIGD